VGNPRESCTGGTEKKGQISEQWEKMWVGTWRRHYGEEKTTPCVHLRNGGRDGGAESRRREKYGQVALTHRKRPRAGDIKRPDDFLT